jgi:hypothetical protein
MTRLRWLVIPLAAAALAAAVLRPVCVPLSPEQLASFTAPIEARTDRDFYLAVFQQREGQWMQCKTWLSRALFF